MSEPQREKLRQSLRHQRDALDASEASEQSAAICARLVTHLNNAEHIAGYLALGKEVDLSALQNSAACEHVSYYVPVVQPQFRMLFAVVDKHTRFTQNCFGILEPDSSASQLKQASMMDVVLVPLVGFDEHCNRMGMGGGYYDRCFEHRSTEHTTPLLIGVAYDLQQTQTVYPEHWDVPLDMIVTPSRTLKRPVLSEGEESAR